MRANGVIAPKAAEVNTRYEALRPGATDCLNIILAARHSTNVMFTLDHRHYRATAPLQDAPAFLLLPADRDQWLATTD